MSKPRVIAGWTGVTKITTPSGTRIARILGWEVSNDNNVIKFGLQGMDLNADGLPSVGKLANWNDNRIDIEAYWLNEVDPADYLSGSHFGLRGGVAGVGTFGFDAFVSFGASFIVGNVRAGSKADDTKPATFRATLEVDGAITYPS